MKFLLADDHSILREGVAEILRQAWPNASVLQARNVEESLLLAAQHPDLDAVLLDLNFPDINGISAIATLNNAAPVIVLSSNEDPVHIRRAMAQGARGYVTKSESAHTLILALNLVISGEIYLPPSLTDMEAAAHPTSAHLTLRQRDVLEAICSGLSNKDIGHALNMSEKTVKVHVSAIFRALNVVNRTQALNAARDAKLVSR